MLYNSKWLKKTIETLLGMVVPKRARWSDYTRYDRTDKIASVTILKSSFISVMVTAIIITNNYKRDL